MDIALMFILAGVVIFLGFFGEIIFRKTKIPDAIFLISFGVAISYFFHWIDPAKFSSIALVFTTFALVFIGFEGALNLNIERLVKGFGKGTLLTLANFFISIGVVTIIAKIAGWSWLNSILLGVILGSISAEIVVPMLKSLGLRETSVLSLTVESALGDVLSVLGALTIINFVKLGGFTWATFADTFLFYFAISAAIGIILGIIWVFFLKYMENISRSYMITIAFMILIFGVLEYLGYGGAFACLSFGLTLGNSKTFLAVLKKENYVFNITPNQKFFFSQIGFFLTTFFFVYLGTLMDFSQTRLIITGIIITMALFMVRPLAVYLTFRKDVVSKDRALMESIVPRGLSAAILAQYPLQNALGGTGNFPIVVLTVVFLSIVLCTILVFMIRHGWFKGFGKMYVGIYKKTDRTFKKEIRDMKKQQRG